MSTTPSIIAQVRISTDLDANVIALSAREGISRPEFLRRAIEHEAQRLRQTRPARPTTLEDLQRQIEALSSQIESMGSYQVKTDLNLQRIALALGINEVK